MRKTLSSANHSACWTYWVPIKRSYCSPFSAEAWEHRCTLRAQTNPDFFVFLGKFPCPAQIYYLVTSANDDIRALLQQSARKYWRQRRNSSRRHRRALFWVAGQALNNTAFTSP